MDQPGTILPVILRPGEVSLDAASAYVDAVTGACSAVGFWFHQQMGRAFRNFDPQPLAVEALDDEAYWRDPLDSLAQTMEAKGWPNRSGGGFVPFIYIGFLPGHGGWAGTVHWDDQAGLIGLGDACLRGISGDTAGCLDIIGGAPVAGAPWTASAGPWPTSCGTPWAGAGTSRRVREAGRRGFRIQDMSCSPTALSRRRTGP